MKMTYNLGMPITWANFMKYLARDVAYPHFKKARTFAHCQVHCLWTLSRHSN